MINNQLDFLDIISILSFFVGLDNIKLNQEQSDKLDQHLKKQDDMLLNKIAKQNDEIIKLLKEKK